MSQLYFQTDKAAKGCSRSREFVVSYGGDMEGGILWLLRTQTNFSCCFCVNM